MSDKYTMRKMRGFYERLDDELARNSCYRNDIETNPVAVGGDAAYLIMKNKLGGNKMREIFDVCKKEFSNVSKRYLGKNIDFGESRFNGSGIPQFSDADIFLPNPYNYNQMDISLRSMGYETSRRKEVEVSGRTVYNNKNGAPVKVEVFVKTKFNHTRPNSSLTIDTILPYSGMKDGCLTALNGMKNIDFIEPKCFSERLVNDLSVSNQIPIKLIEDIRVADRYLSVLGSV